MRNGEGRRRRGLGAAAPTEWDQGVDSKGRCPHNPKLSCSVAVLLQHRDKANNTFNNSAAGGGLGQGKLCQGQEEQEKDEVNRKGRFELTPDPSHAITPGGLSLCLDLKRCWESLLPKQLTFGGHSALPPFRRATWFSPFNR